ncbi:unnamed protein product [Symbiodinium sp. CCMP2456]|nr:unnamed protein product [Symbiodinium sp. CCMP2456]
MQQSGHVPGLTDRRYEGVIATYRADKGFGFIRCSELRQKFPEKDVFLHGKQLGAFKEGDAVSFAIFLNRDGKPQATDLTYLNGDGMQQQQQQQHQQGMLQGMQHQGMQMHQGMHPGMPCMGHPAQAGSMMAQIAPPPHQAMPDEDVQEVEVPKEFVAKLTSEGGRLHELKHMAGSDITITFQTRPELVNKAVAIIRGPKVSASLGAILLMQELSELIQIPVCRLT